MRPPPVRDIPRRGAAGRSTAGRSTAHLLAPPALVAALAMTLALLAAGGAPAASPVGMLDAGAVVRWGVPAGRLLLDLSAILTVGSLLVAAASPSDGRGRAALRTAAAWAAAWAVTAVAVAALTVWDISGVPPQNFPVASMAGTAMLLAPTRALLLVAALTTVVAVVAVAGGRRPHAVLALALAVLALAPPLYAGHSVHGANEQVASGALVVHVVAATLWLGGLVGLALHFRASDLALPAAADRFSSLALVSFCALSVTGVLTALAGLGVSPALWASAYGAVVVVKVVAAVGLGAIGWTHRRWTLPQLRAGRPGAFARLVAVELLVMGATVGVAVALSRTPGASATGFLERANRSAGVAVDVAPVTFGNLLSDWRPEPVLTAVVVVALVVYLQGVRRVAHLGPRWSARRQGLGIAAAAVAIVALGLPTGYDAGPLLAVQTVQHLLLAFAVPALVALSGAAELVRPADDVGGERGWRRLLAEPALGFVALAVGTVAVLQSPLQVDSTINGPAHIFVLSVSLATGAMFARSVLGIFSPARRPVIERLRVLVAAILFLQGLGGVLAVTGDGAGSLSAAVVVWLATLVLAPVAVAVLRRQRRAEIESDTRVDRRHDPLPSAARPKG